jgi:hypothetical protein
MDADLSGFLTSTQEIPPGFGMTEISSHLSNSFGSSSPSHVKAQAMPAVSTISKTIKAFISNPPYYTISAVWPGILNGCLPFFAFQARAQGSCRPFFHNSASRKVHTVHSSATATSIRANPSGLACDLFRVPVPLSSHADNQSLDV